MVPQLQASCNQFTVRCIHLSRRLLNTNRKLKASLTNTPLHLRSKHCIKKAKANIKAPDLAGNPRTFSCNDVMCTSHSKTGTESPCERESLTKLDLNRKKKQQTFAPLRTLDHIYALA